MGGDFGGWLGGLGAFKDRVTGAFKDNVGLGAFKDRVTGAFRHIVIFDFLCL